jgi:hypothetical protein
MKKALVALIVGIAVALFVGFAFLIYKTWTVFGFWTMTWTGLASFFSGTVLEHIFGSRSETNGRILYNPRELPKFIHIIICGLLGYYLYTRIIVPGLAKSDYYFGLAYLTFQTVLPVVFSIYRLIRDKDDFVAIEGNAISYKDNEKVGRFELSSIASIDTFGSDLTLKFVDGTEHKIELSNMNFNVSDVVELTVDLKARLPKANAGESAAS